MSETNVILTTPAQLQAIIGEAVGAIIPKLADFRRKNEAVETDALTLEQAVTFITEQGIPTTRSTLYNLVYKDSIPYRKVGRRTIFSRRELTEWLESRTQRPASRRSEAAERIARNAQRK